MSAGASPPTVAARIGEVITNAQAKTGLDDFGGDSWREGLEVLVRAAQTEGQFNEFGEESFYASLVRPLINRLNIEDWYRRHPEIDEQEVYVELLGVGFPRTGSTALSHLLAEDPAFRDSSDLGRARSVPATGGVRGSRRSTHGSGADHRDAGPRAHGRPPAVDAAAVRDRTDGGPRSDGPRVQGPDLPGVGARTLLRGLVRRHCDMEPTYRYEKRVLKLLQWRTPEKTWRLKSPTHTMFLDVYERVFPDTRFVQTHRDVSKALPSVADLYYTMLQGGNPGIDPAYVGELNMEQWGIALDRILVFRHDPACDARFFDIGFTQFQADPIAEIRKLYEWLGDDLTDTTVERMLAWRADNPADKHGKQSTTQPVRHDRPGPRCTVRCVPRALRRIAQRPGYGTTRNAPRMNGWTRHQNVYVPGGRSVGVSQVRRPAVGGPSLPSCPESNSIGASAVGNAIPVERLHGNVQSVIVCQVP